MKYFAYGSNMDQEQMKKRCPDSVLLGKAVLNDYKISFTIFSPIRKCGCADIIPSQYNEVWGLLYEISETDLKNLDEAEGHPVHYKRFQVSVKDEDGQIHEAESYEVLTKQADFIKPSEHYLGLMIRASKEFDFPEDYQLQLSEIETLD